MSHDLLSRMMGCRERYLISELQAVEEGHGLDISEIINGAISSDGVHDDLSDDANLIAF